MTILFVHLNRYSPIIVILLLLFAFSDRTHAATLRIGGGSTYPCNEAGLKRALGDANPDDTIFFSATCQTVRFTSTEGVTLDKDLTLDSVGGVTLSGEDNSRVLTISAGTDVTVQEATITNGTDSGIYNEGTLRLIDVTVELNDTADNGGGIYNDGTLTLAYSTVSNNIANLNFGGGIYNNGTMNIGYSTINTNSAVSGGNIYNAGNMVIANTTISGSIVGQDGAGIYNAGNLTIANSAIRNNFAASDGGGIFNAEALTIYSSTFVSNSADDGGGIYNDVSVTLANTILADNTGGDYFENGSAPTIAAPTIVEDRTITGALVINRDPRLDADLLPEPDSPAVDAGDDAFLPSEGLLNADVNGDGDQSDGLFDLAGEFRIRENAIDIGAYELQVIPADGPDVNRDGVISPADAIYVINRIGGNDVSADVDGNGSVEDADAQIVIESIGEAVP